MLAYVFKAKNNEGTLVSGNMRADRRETAVSALKQKGYYLLSVEPESKFLRFFRSDAGFRSHVSVRQKAVFTHQLATLLRAGIRLSIALNTLLKQTEISIWPRLSSSCAAILNSPVPYPKRWQNIQGSSLGSIQESSRLPKNLAA